MHRITDLELLAITYKTMKISARLKFLLINIAAAIIIIIIIGFIVLSRLDNYTRHGESIIVPSFENLTPAEAEQVAEHNNLRTTVIDSLFDETAQPGVILEQYPSSGAKVKESRLIHLTVNARSPEKIVFPNLKNSAFRQTLQTLESRGFKIGRISFEESEFKNLVLNLKQKDQDIEAGALLPKGSVIDIVLGNGNADNVITVPRLTGKNLNEAISLAHQGYMNIGDIVPDASIQNKSDWPSALVYQQTPGVTGVVEAGTPVNLYITLQKNKITSIDTLIVTE